MESEGEQVNFINIGIGLNVNNDPPKLDPPAVSLKGLLGRAVARRDILSRFLDAMEQGIAAEPWDRVIGEWKTFSVTLNRPVRIVTTKGETRGVAMDVGENGALLLRQADGTIVTVLYGDCFLAGADTSRSARGGGARLSAADRK
jgi:BirA family biotin operon repressor/biotin-[acetyl-CoA-carboxylase] ligase